MGAALFAHVYLFFNENSCCTSKITPHNHEIVNIIKENKAFPKPWYFMILAFAEHPK
jgi:hypothetical protein